QSVKRPPATLPAATAATAATASPATSTAKRLTWNEQRELERMEESILAAETELANAQQRASDPATLADHVKLRDAYEKLHAAQEKVEFLYARWTELEARKNVR